MSEALIDVWRRACVGEIYRRFAEWFEAFLGGRWYTFDTRNNTPRIGRILMARGRDATDVAISMSFGRSTLMGFRVTTEEAHD